MTRKPLLSSLKDSLKSVEMMDRENMGVLTVIYPEDGKIAGIHTYKDVLSAYMYRSLEPKWAAPFP